MNDIRPKVQWDGKEPPNNSPIYDYCRKLIKDGVEPSTLLEIYRGEILSVSVNIGEGSKWSIRETETRGPSLKKYTSSPYQKNANVVAV